MDYRIKAVLDNIKDLQHAVTAMPQQKLDQAALQKGLDLSANTCRQQPYVYATPLMKNLMVVLGDVKQTQDANGEWHTEKLETGAKSRAVVWINDVVKRCLLKWNGAEKTHYDSDLPVDSLELYNTDCWLGWKPEVWDIAPGQAEQRRKVFQEYSRPKTNFSVNEMIKALGSDVALQKAVILELGMWPEIRAARDVQNVSDPFMNKKTGVSYPDYHNDAALVPGTKQTYGEYEVELARRAYAKGLREFLAFGYANNVYTGYPRNQRGKGRALEAQSRRTNLVVNLVNGPEMDAWKAEPFIGTAFQDESGIKNSLIQLAEFVLQHDGYVAQNKDYTGWDRTVGEGWIYLSNAMRMLKANGETAKEIIRLRNACNLRSVLVDGPNHKVHPLFGRTPSGYLDTTLVNTTINRVLSTADNIHCDPNYTENIFYPSRGRCILTVGDDYLGIMKKGSDKEFVNYAKQYGFEAHADFKDAFGVMFIQYRLVKKDGQWIMAYNWPRVLRSMLSKEDQKALGAAGWTLSFYQQLGKLREYPEMMAIPLNIAAALDKQHLMLDVPIAKIKQMVQDEDQARVKEGSTERKSKLARSRTTAERLNSQPQFAHQFNAAGDIDYDYFGKLQAELRALYDPQFLPKLGFKLPDLSKVMSSGK